MASLPLLRGHDSRSFSGTGVGWAEHAKPTADGACSVLQVLGNAALLSNLLALFFFCSGVRAMVATMDPARRRATSEDLLQVPDILTAEIVDGELDMSRWWLESEQ